MIKNYLTTAIRNLLRYKLFSAINILGLGVGFACCTLILLFVWDELSYDAFLPDSENIYTVQSTINIPGRAPIESAQSVPALAAAMAADLPEVENITRLYGEEGAVKVGDKVFAEQIAYTDRNFLEVIGLPFVLGDAGSALADPSGIVLSRSLAEKYFGDVDPIGKTVSITRRQEHVYRVSGVFEDLPGNSHFFFSLIAPLERGLFNLDSDTHFLDRWTQISIFTYLKLAPNVAAEQVAARLDEVTDRYFPGDVAKRLGKSGSELFDFRLLEIRDIHLYGFDRLNQKPAGNIQTVLAFLGLAGLVLAVAVINFVNLSTARSTQRAREVAVRKVLGAKRRNLFVQFQGEALLMTVLAVLVGAVLVELALPYYSAFTERLLSLGALAEPRLMAGLGALVLVVAIGAGAHPAWIMSGYRPAKTLKANQSAETTGSIRLRSSLVVIQFAVSIALMISTIIIYKQTDFARTLDPGFKKEGLLVLRGLGSDALESQTRTFLERLEALPSVTGATRSSLAPGDQSESIFSLQAPGDESGDPILVSRTEVDFDFFETYGIEMAAGRALSPDFGQDIYFEFGAEKARSEASVVINESAVARLGFG
ncbi:MAG: ABC transporter permease, partial [Sphingomonadales bacterium]